MVSPRYTGHWENVKDNCMLCEMDKKTKWIFETKDWVIAEKLGSNEPFVVYKRHKSYLSNAEWQEMDRIVSIVYDEYEPEVIMNHCEDHWHAHLRDYEMKESFK